MSNGLECREVVPDGGHILIRHFRIVDVGHGRIEVDAALTYAGLEGRPELLPRPVPDACFLVQGDVRGNDVAEGGFDWAPSRKGLPAAGDGMAGRTVRRNRQILALLNAAEILFIGTLAFLVASTGESDTRSGGKFCALMHGQAAPDF